MSAAAMIAVLWPVPGVGAPAPAPTNEGASGQVGSLPIRHLVSARRPAAPPLRTQSASDEAIDEAGPPRPLGDFSVTLTAPAHGDLVGGRMEIRAEVIADRPDDVLFVEFAVDGRVLFADATAPYELVWTIEGPGPHRVVARAYGPTGEMVEDVVRTAAPPPGTNATAAFHSRADQVELFVRVEDEDEAGELGVADFVLLEDGVEQPIVAVERVVDLPVAIGFLVDCSGSMVEKLEMALDTAGTFIDGLLEQEHDKAFVMAFADLPSMLQEFTDDVDMLSGSLDLISQGRYTKLYDSLVSATDQFDGHEGRRAMVVLTDGHDANSEADIRAAIRAAQSHDVAIYPVAVDVSPRFHYERWVLSQIARSTGGRVSYMQRRDDPERVYGAIAEDLRAQYRITYAPLRHGGDGEWREIEVKLAEERKGKVRSRPGYFAR